MAKIPSRVSDRIVSGIKKFKPIVEAARTRDVGEADTVTLTKVILAEVFGYDKYSEVTSEHAIRGTYCDLAITIEGDLALLLEVKAVGLDLKEPHVKQAVDYAANKGVEWVVLTNAMCWRIYKIAFTKPIQQELVVEFNFGSVSVKSERDLHALFCLCKEGWQKSVLGEYHSQQQALSRFFLGAILLSDPVIEVVRRELRRLSPDARIAVDEVRNVLIAEVLKREVTEGEKAEEARRKVARALNKVSKSKRDSDAEKGSSTSVATASDNNAAS